MLDKYIKINDKEIIAGQTSGGIWYIKELPAENPKQLDALIGELNIICNKYNKQNDGSKKNKKLPSPPTKGKGLD